MDGRWQVLDWRWNAMNYMSERLPKAPFIRHFAGNKPWNAKKLGVERRFVDEWRADLKVSPWPDSFQERTAKHIIREVTNPVTLGLENLAKSVVYSRSQGRRGNKARMWKNFPKVLAAIEQAALEGRLAERFPEKGLLA
jgi:lipopolysaccharide biosynthesis glycosyltransferase